MGQSGLDELPAILGVDDSPANLLALEAVLEPLGYRFVAARSGEEALKLCAAQDFVLLLVDVHMPGLDGYQTTALLRQIERVREVPVIFITAIYNLLEHTRRGYALGAVDYLTKPVDPEVLRAKVRALVTLYARGRNAERRRSEAAERARDLFLGAVGHDLRNPLNTVLMAASLLSKEDCEPERRRVLAQRIEKSSRRMQAMIEDILDLTRQQFAGEIPLSIEPTSLGDVCRTIVAELRLAHPDRPVRVDVPVEVYGDWDPARLGRVLSNLVSNALEHVKHGEVSVFVRDAGPIAEVAVHDEGDPIPPEVFPELFEPFRRRKGSAQGLGLGLYIVREIARAHGGNVEVASTPTEGTTFTVSLPKKKPA